ncbi:MAG TPA: hypothetical protein K8W21_01885 [Enorma massiliensis]|uniref:hypothetical protein n=1 Tax=Enorma massiliensis TaxID=1472761 RepID=UPI001D836761|nr:hypothetical protein [Enorma massiliensis]HJG61719.1 hypothetical protein [Enorma massiliensis]
MAVTYAYYFETYGGGLPEAAFSSCINVAEAHVKWLCAAGDYCPNSNAFKRAVCAVTEAFAEFGSGEVGGYSIGQFSVKNYENKGTTGEELATQAALHELAGTGYAFCGVGR